jgi:hypothetical protein
VTDVGGDDGPAPGHFVTHELRRQVLAQGHEAHLLRDLALPGVVHLGEVAVAARLPPDDPGGAQLGQSHRHIVPLRPGGVVDPHRRVPAREGDLSHRHPQLPVLQVLLGRPRQILRYRAQTLHRRRGVDPRSGRPRPGLHASGDDGQRSPDTILVRAHVAPSAGITRIRFVGSRRALGRRLSAVVGSPGVWKGSLLAACGR